MFHVIYVENTGGPCHDLVWYDLKGITGSSATILQYSMNLPKGPKGPSRSLFAQPIGGAVGAIVDVDCVFYF